MISPAASTSPAPPDVPAAGAPACPNCGQEAPGKYCPACGQRQRALRPSMRAILSDFTRYFFRIDSKFLATLKGVFVPGFLTREYLAGRRERYEKPFRLYVVVNVLYFLVSAWVPHGTFETRTSEGFRKGVARLQSETHHSLLYRKMEQAAKDPAALELKFRAEWLRVGPKLTLLLLPLFAALLRLVYLRRDFRYAEHFVFVLHLQTFTLVTSSAMIASTSVALRSIVAGINQLYLLLALHRVHGEGWGKTALRWIPAGALMIFTEGIVTGLVVMGLVLFA